MKQVMKHFTIYQLPVSNNNIFRSLKADSLIYGADYVAVWQDDLNEGGCHTDEEFCESLFITFNANRPKHYAGHSLSVSDIISIYDPDTAQINYYYCDAFGWQNVTDKIIK